MTTEERFERIEHVMAGLAEERRKDREEYRALWRDTQRQILEVSRNVSELAVRVHDTNDTLARLIEAADKRVEESRERDKALDERIGRLVSSIGEFISRVDKRDGGAK